MSDSECPICCEEKPTSRLFCGHRFHRRCLDDLVEHRLTHPDDDGELRCPVCRTDVDPAVVLGARWYLVRCGEKKYHPFVRSPTGSSGFIGPYPCVAPIDYSHDYTYLTNTAGDQIRAIRGFHLIAEESPEGELQVTNTDYGTHPSIGRFWVYYSIDWTDMRPRYRATGDWLFDTVTLKAYRRPGSETTS